MNPFTLMEDPLYAFSLTLAGLIFIPLTLDSFIVETGEPVTSSKSNFLLFLSARIKKCSKQDLWITTLFSEKSTSLLDITANFFTFSFLYFFEELEEKFGLGLLLFEASTEFEFLDLFFSDT